MGRDWSSDLWEASFKGVPFWVDEDKDSIARRLVVHEFPGRDDPFIEDLGAKARTFDITAYLIGDDSDAEADALIAMLLQLGPGLLVLPAQGPINPGFMRPSGAARKTRPAISPWAMKFYREGSSFALAPVDMLAQLVFDAGDALVGAATSVLDSMVLQ